ncbi:hypothetical protein [Pseudomonas sp. Root562]|uniref:hypothetical protein n=1 Tax=Pseudomonas sp. Root562 TaxID=1736561 RepID=UPI0007033367|nr:hypothetical protein [Pseudomonas sp. Root562]KQZ81090.1 hypothetical protein ASD60_12320 [Pseudomonas sp. Root562]
MPTSRHENIRSSIVELRTLLLDLIKQPQLASTREILRTAIKSQGALAASELSIDKKDGGIIHKPSMSLNTLKSYADITISGGFKELDHLRKKALDSITTFQSKNLRATKRTKSGLNIRFKELEAELEAQRQINYILLQAISTAMNGFKTIRDAPDSAIREKRTDDSLKTLRAIISMKPSFIRDMENFEKNEPIGFSTVTNINLYRKEEPNRE